MKIVKISCLVLVISLLVPTIALAQAENPPASTKESKRTSGSGQTAAEQKAEKGKASALTGWVKTEGDKVVFVNDKDKQTWNVENPDVLKPHDGQHVKVNATLNKADKSLTVNNAKELKSNQSKKQRSPKP